MRCKKYNPSNEHWKIVDALLTKQVGITKKIEENTAALENNDDMNREIIVSDFMNKKYPSKGSKNVDNINTKSVTNLESDESVDSLNMDINKEAEGMVWKAKD